MRVGLLDDPLFREHDAGPGHPERPARLDALRRGLRGAGLEERLILSSPRPASEAEILRVHTAAHLDRVRRSAGRSVQFDPDTRAGPRSCEAALLAAGAAVEAVDRVLAGEWDRGFCAVRPPGHHAEADRAMGFCLLNNVAIAAAHALECGLDRVLVVDFDVHHGNGTQAIFAEEPRVLYVSSHAYPFYPGTGSLSEVGVGDGVGFTVNLPLPHGLGDGEYVRLYRDVVLPIARSFDPELVLVSAGFDAHNDDPLAGMAMTSAGYGELARTCLDAAAGMARGRVVMVLEGGYDLEGIASSSAAVVGALLGDAGVPVAPARGGAIEDLVGLVRAQHGRAWPVLRS